MLQADQLLALSLGFNSTVGDYFGLFSVGDVQAHAHHSQRSSGRVAVYFASALDPPNFALRADDTVFNFEVALWILERPADRLHKTLAVLGVNIREYAFESLRRIAWGSAVNQL